MQQQSSLGCRFLQAMEIRGLITRLLGPCHIRHLILCSLGIYSILVQSVHCRHHDIGSSTAHQLGSKYSQSSSLSSSSQSSSSLVEEPALNKDSGNYQLLVRQYFFTLGCFQFPASYFFLCLRMFFYSEFFLALKFIDICSLFILFLYLWMHLPNGLLFCCYLMWFYKF